VLPIRVSERLGVKENLGKARMARELPSATTAVSEDTSTEIVLN
jgi:hypothetical protein